MPGLTKLVHASTTILHNQMPGRSDRATTKIFVGNLPDRYPDDSLRELFEQYGEVSECDVIKNFAFVHFVSEEEAESAVKGLKGAEVKGKNIRVEISEKVKSGVRFCISSKPGQIRQDCPAGRVRSIVLTLRRYSTFYDSVHLGTFLSLHPLSFYPHPFSFTPFSLPTRIARF